MASRILILSYHSISHEHFHDIRHVDPVFSISREQLKNHFETIRNLNIPVIPLNRVNELTDGSPLKIVLTFDDGHPSDFEFVMPLLKEYGYTATFFICLRNIQMEKRWDEYIELAACGNILGAHGITHQFLTHLTTDRAADEMKQSAEMIRIKTGSPCNYFAFPGGRFNHSVVKTAIDAGFTNALSTDFGFFNPIDKKFVLNRWQIRRSTTESEFSDLLQRKTSQVLLKKVRSRFMNAGKFILGDQRFEKIRNLLIPA